MKDKDREEHPSRKQKLHVGSSDLNDDQNISSDSRAPPQASESDKTDNDIDAYAQLLAKIFPEEDVNYYKYEYPPGYRFKPHDYELVAFYLRRKLQSKSLPRNVVHDVDLYLCNPESLKASYPIHDEKKEWYFFTPRNKKYPNGRRPDRAAGNGYWKASGADQTVTCKVEGKEIIVGFKKTLVFYEGKASKGDKTDWIMHEFTLRNPPKRIRAKTDTRLDDWVLCRIHKKEDKKDPEQHDDDAPQEETDIPSVPENCSRGSPLGYFARPAGTSACCQNSGIISAQQNARIATPENRNHQSRFVYNHRPTSTSACYHNSGISTEQKVAARATATPFTVENQNHQINQMGHRGRFVGTSACYQNFRISVQHNAFTEGPGHPIMIENHNHRSQFRYHDRPGTAVSYRNSPNVLSTVTDRVAVPSIASKQSPIHVPDTSSYDLTIDTDELFLTSDFVDGLLNLENDDVPLKSLEDGAK